MANPIFPHASLTPLECCIPNNGFQGNTLHCATSYPLCSFPRQSSLDISPSFPTMETLSVLASFWELRTRLEPGLLQTSIPVSILLIQNMSSYYFAWKFPVTYKSLFKCYLFCETVLDLQSSFTFFSSYSHSTFSYSYFITNLLYFNILFLVHLSIGYTLRTEHCLLHSCLHGS